MGCLLDWALDVLMACNPQCFALWQVEHVRLKIFLVLVVQKLCGHADMLILRIGISITERINHLMECWLQAAGVADLVSGVFEAVGILDT